MTSGRLWIRPTYSVNVTASGESVFESGNNWRLCWRLKLQIKQLIPHSRGRCVCAPPGGRTTADESITLPISGSDMTVDWGDGNTTTASVISRHIYNTAGDYTVQITGDLTRFHLNDAAVRVQTGLAGSVGQHHHGPPWSNAFYGADNMAYNAADSPDLSSLVTDMSEHVRREPLPSTATSHRLGCLLCHQHEQRCSASASSFNQPLFNDWDVSSVNRHVHSMFHRATSFDQHLNSWNVSSVNSMNRHVQ